MPERRPIKKSLLPPSPYKYNSDAEGEAKDKCETFEDYHVVRPSEAAWPPQPHGPEDTRPTSSLRCTLCGTWCIVYGDNDPERSRVLIVQPERKRPAATAITT